MQPEYGAQVARSRRTGAQHPRAYPRADARDAERSGRTLEFSEAQLVALINRHVQRLFCRHDLKPHQHKMWPIRPDAPDNDEHAATVTDMLHA